MLIALLEIPKTLQLRHYWAAQHQDQHWQIRKQLLGTADIPDYIFDPMPSDLKIWAEQHQVVHSKFCAAVGISPRDLRSVDFSDEEQLKSWIEFHFDEHRLVAEALGIT